MTLSYKDVAEILKIIDASSCDEVVLELGDTRLVVRRGGTSGDAGARPAIAAGTATAGMATSAPQQAPASSTVPQQAASSGGEQIRAPMVGAFYRRPAPDKPPFVEVGARIKPGDPLCLIEVMKLYTTIEATKAGVVRQIAAEDGQLVEFDQVLFVIDPS